MSRPARALLNARALRHNLEQVRLHAPHSRVMSVIKANAYGHGLVWAARVLSEADAFGVACIEEGLELRRAGIEQPICVLEGFFDAAELPLLQQYRLSPVIHHEAQLQALEQFPSAAAFDVWCKIDTGMHRLGFPVDRAADTLQRLRICPAVREVGLLSHFANADDIADHCTQLQMQHFFGISEGTNLRCSLANSAGILAWPSSCLDWVRPGIMLYGVSPLADRSAADINLRSVMTLESAIIAVHSLRKGDAVGYGGDWVCPEDMTVGVVAIGYGDGYPRHANTGTPVLINGQRVPLIGRVSMDMITVDLRNQPQARIGDRVVLWGEGLPVEEIAANAGTIGYALLCGVTPRIPRVEASPQ